MKLPFLLPKRQRGATAIEYALLAALIALVLAAGATALGTDLSAMFTFIGTKLPAA
ncbi:Flp family type IVb pilin [Jeongeupia sp. USM3]|uniref:Flp family type IVb pilin n=1 Tax=Jeongeupia sp. USM3 TaxID=1906741 RepID=UPI0009F3587D|nr:Flp family type IVb pilin [Jeongeupia sp. USM3]